MPEREVTPSLSSRAEYARRVHRVLEHIDRHLDQTLDLPALARVAHFSAFHFHRVFAAWMGETLGEYLRRRRLEVAALRLATQPDASVLDVSLAVGFGSPEAFARAFKSRFGSPPTRWRREQRNPDQILRKLDQESTVTSGHPAVVRETAQEPPMEVKLVERKPLQVAYLRHIGPYGQPLSTFWQEVAYPWMLAHDLMGLPRYGVIHDDPGITQGMNCRYDAAIGLPPSYPASPRMLTTTLAGGRCAVTPFLGTVDDVGPAWTRFLREWLPESGMQLDSRPFLEHYPTDSTWDPETGKFSCELCIPLVDL